MLSDESKRKIDELSREALLEEINKGNKSRLQGEKFAYAKTRRDLLEQQDIQHQIQQQLSLDAEANKIAKEANDIAREAATTSKRAYRMSVFSVIVAIIAALIALLPQCTTKP